MTEPVRKWRVTSETSLRWKTWDDDFIVYHCESGDTHRLNVVSAEALRRLESSAVSAEALASHVADALGIEPDEELLHRIDELIAQFEHLGLIDPVDEPE